MPKLINLPKIADPRGNLSFFEENNQIPFAIKRTYWIYDVRVVKPEADTLLNNKRIYCSFVG